MAEPGTVVTVAQKLVADRFPQARAAWLGGSIAAGMRTATSDLDITVLLAGPPAPIRASETFSEWPVELFVQTEASLNRFCELDRDRRRPTTMRLVGSSIIVLDRDGSGRRLQESLHRIDMEGPPPATAAELEAQRYVITDLLADMTAPRSDDEMLAVATALAESTANFVLTAHRRWGGSGKWLWRELTTLDELEHTRHVSTLLGGLRAASAGDPVPLREAVGSVLKRHGGPVFDGFHRGGPTP
ncbi:nucleotidyltransferase domain-containing protein [Mycobacterium sp. MBM]|nr:nucleotidyltransferase domain-containing protein [Mycobacterium sp. MBM]